MKDILTPTLEFDSFNKFEITSRRENSKGIYTRVYDSELADVEDAVTTEVGSVAFFVCDCDSSKTFY